MSIENSKQELLDFAIMHPEGDWYDCSPGVRIRVNPDDVVYEGIEEMRLGDGTVHAATLPQVYLDVTRGGWRQEPFAGIVPIATYELAVHGLCMVTRQYRYLNFANGPPVQMTVERNHHTALPMAVSRKQAQVQFDGELLLIVDRRSKNGTSVFVPYGAYTVEAGQWST